MPIDEDKCTHILWQATQRLKQFPASYGSGYALTLFTLVWGLEAQLVYEIGVSIGQSTTLILTALGKTGGQLVSCDIANCSSVIADHELAQRWTFHQMTSLDFLAMLNQPAQMIYIDGDHGFTGVRHEVRAAWPLLQVGGLIVLHDTRPESLGPGRVLQMVRREGIEALELPYGQGFGLIHKRGGDPAQLDLPLTPRTF